MMRFRWSLHRRGGSWRCTSRMYRIMCARAPRSMPRPGGGGTRPTCRGVSSLCCRLACVMGFARFCPGGRDSRSFASSVSHPMALCCRRIFGSRTSCQTLVSIIIRHSSCCKERVPRNSRRLTPCCSRRTSWPPSSALAAFAMVRWTWTCRKRACWWMNRDDP